MESIDRALFDVKKNQIKMVRDRGYLFPEDSNDESILEATYEQFRDYLLTGLKEINPDTRKSYTLSQLLNQVYVDPTSTPSLSEGERADIEQQRREEEEDEEGDDEEADEEEDDDEDDEEDDEADEEDDEEEADEGSEDGDRENDEDEESEDKEEAEETSDERSHERKGERVFVWFPAEFETGKKVGNKELDPLFEEIGETDVRHLIVVTKFPLSDMAKRRIRESTVVRFEVFLYHEMRYNPIEHFLVPKHRILDKEERKNFLRQFPDYTKLPYMNLDDRVGRHLGVKVGDLVEIDAENINYEGDVSRSLRVRVVRRKDPGLLMEIERATNPVQDEAEDE